MSLPEPVKQRIEGLIAKDDVVLFMKGTRESPRCGFSATVVGILDGLDANYATIDVLADPELREGIKAFSSWPTIPQLYVRGEFLGGADITKAMADSGELHQKLGVTPAQKPSHTPVITITTDAARVLAAAHSQAAADEVLRLSVDRRFRHQLGFGPKNATDAVCTSEGIHVHVDASSAARADGIRIDVVKAPDGSEAFRIDNPNDVAAQQKEPLRVKQMSVAELKSMLDAARTANTPLALFDVRTPGEAAIARIEGARLLDDAGRAMIDTLPKETPLVFHCHHGGRSQAAAEHYLGMGFKHVSNVAGGIDAWSQVVDPSVPRY